MVFSASGLPLIHVPSWWAEISHAFPVTDGVASLYNIMVAQPSATSAWGIGGLIPLLTIPTAYLLAASAHSSSASASRKIAAPSAATNDGFVSQSRVRRSDPVSNIEHQNDPSLADFMAAWKRLHETALMCRGRDLRCSDSGLAIGRDSA
jgi:hypothetical protein